MSGSHERTTGGELNAAIANAVVRIHTRHVGRGPAGAQAFFRHNVLVVMLHDASTKAERSLIDGGKLETALLLRRQVREAMTPALVEAVEQLTGCSVLAFMGDSHFDPDLQADLFVLDADVLAEGRPAPDG
jgi:uncharacterized protein YbcI